MNYIPEVFLPRNKNEIKDVFMCYKASCVLGFLDKSCEENHTIGLSNTQLNLSRVGLLDKDYIVSWVDKSNVSFYKQSTFGRKQFSEINFDKVFITGNNNVKLWNDNITNLLDKVMKKTKTLYVGDDEFSHLILKYVWDKVNDITLCYSENNKPKFNIDEFPRLGKMFVLQINQYDVDRFNEQEFRK